MTRSKPRLLTMTFTTAAFDRSSSWQFEASSYTATPRGPPSSLLQHDARASSWHNYVQAFDGAVTLTVAGYNYDIDWTPMSAGLAPAGMAASFAAPLPQIADVGSSRDDFSVGPIADSYTAANSPLIRLPLNRRRSPNEDTPPMSLRPRLFPAPYRRGLLRVTGEFIYVARLECP